LDDQSKIVSRGYSDLCSVGYWKMQSKHNFVVCPVGLRDLSAAGEVPCFLQGCCSCR